MSESRPSLLRVTDLRVSFAGTDAVRGLSLDIRPGQSLGLVGESGCGKSVSVLALLGLLGREASVCGSALFDGVELVGASERDLTTLRGRRIGLVFQDPLASLNPMRSIGEQIDEVVRLHRGLHGDAVRAETRNLLERTGLPNPARLAEAYPHELSGGQNQRVGIAIALAGAPDLLIADEPTTALDPTVQAQILDLLRSIQRESGMAMLLISHDLSVIADVCDDVAVMYAGEAVEQAPAQMLFRRPSHPYTQALLAALPALDGPRKPLRPLAGSLPDPKELPPGCLFSPRCDFIVPACARAQTMRTIAADHLVRCHRAAEGV